MYDGIRCHVALACSLEPVFTADVVVKTFFLNHITFVAAGVLYPHLAGLIIDDKGIEFAGFEITSHRLKGIFVPVVLRSHADHDGVVLDVVTQETDDDVLDDGLGLQGSFLRSPDRVCLSFIVLPCRQQTFVNQFLNGTVRGRVYRIIIVIKQGQVLVLTLCPFGCIEFGSQFGVQKVGTVVVEQTQE